MQSTNSMHKMLQINNPDYCDVSGGMNQQWVKKKNKKKKVSEWVDNIWINECDMLYSCLMSIIYGRDLL